MKLLAIAMLAATAALALPASAQDAGSWNRIVLEGKTGSVMTSSGDAYQTANIGQQLTVGEHMMLSGDAPTARLGYYMVDASGNVTRKCVREFSDPNTYIVDGTCVAAVANVPWHDAGIIVGAGVLAGVLMSGDNDEYRPPLSAALR